MSKFKKYIYGLLKKTRLLAVKFVGSYVDSDNEKSVLEKTINDLTEDSSNKNKHMQKKL